MKLQSRTRLLRHTRSAFTLMEVLVVVAILVVLAGIGVMVFRYLDESKEKVALVGTKNLETAVSSYKLNTGDFPPDLDTLAQPANDKPAYIERKSLLDPWNRPYQYDATQISPTGVPLIYSAGAIPGQSQPIRNWN